MRTRCVLLSCTTAVISPPCFSKSRMSLIVLLKEFLPNKKARQSGGPVVLSRDYERRLAVNAPSGEDDSDEREWSPNRSITIVLLCFPRNLLDLKKCRCWTANVLRKV